MRRDAPLILRVEGEALHVLAEGSVARRSVVAGDAGGRIGRGRTLVGRRHVVELRRVGHVVRRILRIGDQLLGGGGKGPAKHRLMNKVDAEARRVRAAAVAHVVAELVLLLVAQGGKERDGRSELIVSIRLISADGKRRTAEGKRQGEAEIRIALLRQMQGSGIQHQAAQPVRTEGELIGDDRVGVVVVRGQSGGRQSSLLHQRVAREVAVGRCAQKPVRALRLRPIQTERTAIVAERNGDRGRHIDIRRAGDESAGGERGKGVKLGGAAGVVGDAGVFTHVLGGDKVKELVAKDGSAERANVVLPGEWLLGIADAGAVGAGLRRILDWVARVQLCVTLVKGEASVRLVAAVAGGDDDAGGRGATGVGVGTGGANGKLLDGVHRNVLQEAANPVIGVVGAIHAEFVVESTAATGADGSDARLGGITGLNRLSARRQVGDVGKAARGQRERGKVLTADDDLVHGAGGVHRFGGDAAGAAFDLHGFAT